MGFEIKKGMKSLKGDTFFLRGVDGDEGHAYTHDGVKNQIELKKQSKLLKIFEKAHQMLSKKQTGKIIV